MLVQAAGHLVPGPCQDRLQPGLQVLQLSCYCLALWRCLSLPPYNLRLGHSTLFYAKASKLPRCEGEAHA